MRRLFLGVNRRRFGLAPDDLSALDGVTRNTRRFIQIKARGPRWFLFGSFRRVRPPNPHRRIAPGRRNPDPLLSGVSTPYV